jgi:hypothetical protein
MPWRPASKLSVPVMFLWIPELHERVKHAKEESIPDGGRFHFPRRMEKNAKASKAAM